MEDKYKGMLRPYDSNDSSHKYRRLTEEDLRDLQPTHSLIQGPKVRTPNVREDISESDSLGMTDEQVIVGIIDMLFKISEIPKSQI